MVHSFTNNNHLDAEDEVCDIFCSDDRCEECDNRFMFCLRNFGDFRSGNRAFCPLGGAMETMAFDNSDAMIFSSLTSLGNSVLNPVIYTGNSWPVRISFCTLYAYSYVLM